VHRIGFGYDAHRLVEGRDLILGGVKIPHEKGLLGHSDADVLIHAIVDAIIGALARGDIGQHFPDTDPSLKGVDSFVMLKAVMEWVKEEGLTVNNLDTTIVAQKPRLAPYIATMQEKISGVLDVGTRQINIKAKTGEGMGFCGREEGMEAFAIISLVKKNPSE
jgi:2-C-methyl-D-erythritol 2,4-cyclodiphosphate synthase